MKTYPIPQTDLVVSRIAYGPHGLSAVPISQASRAISAVIDQGITLFDIVNHDAALGIVGETLRKTPRLRDKIILQSKCGIRHEDEPRSGDPVRADFSREHIRASTEECLRRLQTDHLDILLLHCFDALVEPQEVAAALDELHRAGKVRHFGVSNQTPAQIQLLKRYIDRPLVINQIQLGLGHPYALVDGTEVLMEFSKGAGKSASLDNAYTAVVGTGTLDYCRLNDIRIEAWSPLRGGIIHPPDDATAEVRGVARALAEIASAQHVSPAAVALAWLLRHPAGLIPIMGATSPTHIIDNCAAERVSLSREEWYRLLVLATEIESRKLQ